MLETVKTLASRYFNAAPRKITPLGGGFYGRVFSVEINIKPFNIIIKIYLYPDFAENETKQLKILAEHSTVKMPEVYYTHLADMDIPHDAILMEYIDGVNAGNTDLSLSAKNTERIANEIIDNLIAYHTTINPEGFGEIGAGFYESDWRIYYFQKAKSIFYKAEKWYKEGILSHDIYSVAAKAFGKYDAIFYLPIQEARLIHGDYNTWNILLSKDLSCVKAVIDPMNCCWADSEQDLYQLNNANGQKFGLLDLYSLKFPLSENFHLKMCFYELFSEIMHYYDASILDCSSILEPAKRMEQQIEYFGI